MSWVCGVNQSRVNPQGKTIWEIAADRGDWDLYLLDALKRHKELAIPTDLARSLYGLAQRTLMGTEIPQIDFSEKPKNDTEGEKKLSNPLPIYDWPLQFKFPNRPEDRVIIPDLSLIKLDDFPDIAHLPELLSEFNNLIDLKTRIAFENIMARVDRVFKFCDRLRSENKLDSKHDNSIQLLLHLIKATVEDVKGSQDYLFRVGYPEGYDICYRLIRTYPPASEKATAWEKFIKFRMAIKDLRLLKPADEALKSLTHFMQVISVSDPVDRRFLEVYKKNLFPIHKPYLEDIVNGRLDPTPSKPAKAKESRSGQELSLTVMQPLEEKRLINSVKATHNTVEQDLLADDLMLYGVSSPAVPEEKVNKTLEQSSFQLSVRFSAFVKPRTGTIMDSTKINAHYRIR